MVNPHKIETQNEYANDSMNISWVKRLKLVKKIMVLEKQIVIKLSKSMIVGRVNVSDKTQAIEVC